MANLTARPRMPIRITVLLVPIRPLIRSDVSLTVGRTVMVRGERRSASQAVAEASDKDDCVVATGGVYQFPQDTLRSQSFGACDDVDGDSTPDLED